MQMLLHFAGFHRQPSSGLLRGLLYLEVCKSCSASGIELKITTFRQSLYFFLVLSFVLFVSEDRKNRFVSCVVGSHRSKLQHIVAQTSQKFNMCDFVASRHAFIAKAGIACDHWCPYIERCCASC